MKVESCVISVILRDRKKPDGTQSVAIRACFHGRVVKTLPVSVNAKYWDKKNQCVKKGYPNAGMINKIINEEKQRVVSLKLKYEANGEYYTAKDLFVDKKNQTSPFIKDIMDSLIEERGLSLNNQQRYKSALSVLKTYLDNDNPLITSLTSDTMQGFCKWCSTTRKIKDGTINTHIKVISSTYKYAIDKGIVEEKTFPFLKFKPWKIYKEKQEPLALTKLQLEVLQSYYANFWTPTITDTVGVILKNQEDKDRILKLNNPLSALCMYLNSFYMQGLALCDLAELKADQFTLKTSSRVEKRMEPIPVKRNGKTTTAYIPIEEEVQFSYYEVKDVQRLKTREKVPLVIELTYTTSSLLHYYMQTASSRGGYLFPIYDQSMDDAAKHKRYKMVQTVIGKKLKELQKAVNKYAKENNVENWVDIPSSFNFYSARHTFASIMAASGVATATIAALMGRTVSGIDNYVHSITSIDQILQAKHQHP